MKDSTALSPMAHTITSFYHHANPLGKDAHWYLVDQAKHPDALRRLFEHDPAPVYDLPYIHSGYREQAFDGPLIIKPVDDDCKTWLNDWAAVGKALALHGPHLALEELRDHFVSLNTVRAPHGDSLFRYADPATFGSVGASLSPQQRLRILGPLTAIHGRYANVNWSLVKAEAPACSDEPAERCAQPLVLTKENLAAVEHYRHNLLAKSLAESHGLDNRVVSSWFQQLITLGAPNEQALAEGSGLLVMQGFTDGLSDDELATLRKTRQGAYWSDTLDALATLTHSQEGT